mmetsp:Transcript_87085/g.244265  ORF Transcript_87085/g.244265 Transcript_87085/m.244265 type:complete len:271 (-) Transcript_87085:2056-2868(-)
MYAQVRGVDLELRANSGLDGRAHVQADPQAHHVAWHYGVEARVRPELVKATGVHDPRGDFSSGYQRQVAQSGSFNLRLVGEAPHEQERLSERRDRSAEKIVGHHMDDGRDAVHEDRHLLFEDRAGVRKVSDGAMCHHHLHAPAWDHGVQHADVARHVPPDDFGADFAKTEREQGADPHDGLLEDYCLRRIGRVPRQGVAPLPDPRDEAAEPCPAPAFFVAVGACVGRVLADTTLAAVGSEVLPGGFHLGVHLIAPQPHGLQRVHADLLKL